jgi:glycerol-3-phosphate dehydrogenase
VVSRRSDVQRLPEQVFDVLILGAGINGAVAAAALAARGARVALIDRGDFGGETSANSSCLVWGGIKYLESGELRLVADLCASRNRLIRSFPSSVREIRFLTSVQKGFRKPAWVVYSGALLYWLMGRCFTRYPQYLGRQQLLQREPLIQAQTLAAGFEYSDAWLVDNDSRFTFNFVQSAKRQGAVTLNYVAALGSRYEQGLWLTDVQDRRSGDCTQIRSRFLINACGPWLDHVNQVSDLDSAHHHLFSRGIHLLVPRITAAERVLAFFASDGRLFFVIPMGQQTCIGTTDTPVAEPQTQVCDADRDFVLANINQLLQLPKPLTRDDIIAERCGVRPLVVATSTSTSTSTSTRAADGTGVGDIGDWLKLSRQHIIDVQNARLSIYGGKLTDCLNVGEEVCEHLQQQGLILQATPADWYGEAPEVERKRFMTAAEATGLDRHSRDGATEPLSQRLWRRYGPRAHWILQQGVDNPRMWQPVLQDDDLLYAEVLLAAEDEMIETLDDFLRRRTLIAMTHRREDLLADPGLSVVAALLFGENAEQQLAEYRHQASAMTMARSGAG